MRYSNWWALFIYQSADFQIFIKHICDDQPFQSNSLIWSFNPNTGNIQYNPFTFNSILP